MPVPARPFGGRDELWSALALGCGGYWGLDAFSYDTADALVRRALELGVRVFDTGPSYSRGKAETRLGAVLASCDTPALVATKVGSVWDGRRIRRDLSPGGLTTSAAASCRRLRRDTIDLVQLHCRYPDEVSDPAVVNALVSLRDGGVCRYIGVSGDAASAQRALDVGSYDCVMVTYNVLDRRARPVITRAQAAGVAVLVKSPLAHMVYAPSLVRPRDARGLWYLARVLKNHRPELRTGRRFRFLNDASAGAAAELALQYSMQPAGVTAAVVGTTRVTHLEALAAAASQPLAAPVLERIERTPGIDEVAS